jgi:MFS family permease
MCRHQEAGDRAQQKKRTGHLLKEGTMKDTVKWRVLFGGFFSYTFDAMDILLLAMCLQAIMADLHLTPAAAGLLATATMIGVALSAVIMGWVSDNYGRRLRCNSPW